MLQQQLNDVLPVWNSCWKTGILHSQGENKADTMFRSLSFLVSVMLKSWSQPAKAPRVPITMKSHGKCWDLKKEEDEQMSLQSPAPYGSMNSLGPCWSEDKERLFKLPRQYFKSIWSLFLKKWGQISPGPEREKFCSKEHFLQTNSSLWCTNFLAESNSLSAIMKHTHMDNHVQQTVSEKGRVLSGLNRDCTRTNKHSHMETIRAVSQGRSLSASSSFSLYSSLGLSLSNFFYS